ncbi:DNA-binding response regulator [Cupriavidus basilensis]|uniref:DNA-binding response regulator n=1 Tax=Cupriavidus basilensis TaxID=68895 RepID=A0ABT6B3Q4_9BURK|nr:response regulator transcription factor [Cupriavidus basilensis]MDF3839504.1 DNA-binding response regulator [Cupriavidus basilensis]
MTTLLLAHNMMLRRGVLRHLRELSALAPVISQTPEWLLEAAPADVPPRPVDFALLDCSGAQADPFLLLDTLCQRLAPRRWLVLCESPDLLFTSHAARLGASGCMTVPCTPEQTRAAVVLVRAGGQCFPRQAFAMPAPSPIGSGGSTARG